MCSSLVSLTVVSFFRAGRRLVASSGRVVAPRRVASNSSRHSREAVTLFHFGSASVYVVVYDRSAPSKNLWARLVRQRLFRPATLPLWGDPLRPDCAAESFLLAANDRRPLLSMAVLNVLISISYLFISLACVRVVGAASVSIKVAHYKAAPAVIS